MVRAYHDVTALKTVVAVNEHGSCMDQARRKLGARAVQTGNETALNELVPIRKKSCAYREKLLCL